MVDTELLRAFVAVESERHFGRAAASLGIAASTLSERIHRLEQLAGTPLLRRYPVDLTPAGERFIAIARESVAIADRSSRRLAELRRDPDAHLRIGVLSHGAGARMTSLVGSFTAEHPEIGVRLIGLPFSETASAVVEGKVDLAFVRPRLGDDRLEEHPLGDEERFAVLPSWDERAHQPGLSLLDLDRDAFLTPAPGTPAAYRSFLHLVADRNGDAPRHVDSGCETAEEFLGSVAAGLGIASTIASFTRHYPWPGVAYVPLRDARPAAATVIVARGRRRQPTEAFVRLLTA